MKSQFYHEEKSVGNRIPGNTRAARYYGRFIQPFWNSAGVLRTRGLTSRWKKAPYSGAIMVLMGTLLATLLSLWLDRTVAMEEPIIVLIDPRRIEQVLNNLINNAIKYSPEGSDIQVIAQPDALKEVALLSIHDDGIGIPKAQQAGIFGRFVRADNARMLGIGGTGLGLYICRESAENQGSTFFISLPLKKVG